MTSPGRGSVRNFAQDAIKYVKDRSSGTALGADFDRPWLKPFSVTEDVLRIPAKTRHKDKFMQIALQLNFYTRRPKPKPGDR
jgi:hypothetical protein